MYRISTDDVAQLDTQVLDEFAAADKRRRIRAGAILAALVSAEIAAFAAVAVYVVRLDLEENPATRAVSVKKPERVFDRCAGCSLFSVKEQKCFRACPLGEPCVLATASPVAYSECPAECCGAP